MGVIMTLPCSSHSTYSLCKLWCKGGSTNGKGSTKTSIGVWRGGGWVWTVGSGIGPI